MKSVDYLETITRSHGVLSEPGGELLVLVQNDLGGFSGFMKLSFTLLEEQTCSLGNANYSQGLLSRSVHLEPGPQTGNW